jgi:hypothetical protein
MDEQLAAILLARVHLAFDVFDLPRQRGVAIELRDLLRIPYLG